MIKNILLTAALFASIGAIAQPVPYRTRVEQYILQYKDLAQAEQKRVGIPAAITLAQGILETEAGKSDLAVMANNHFGIKCKKNWTGETFAHDDDAPQECFRKYASALLSYRDHSDYLRATKRYESCFLLSPVDYAAWAIELRKCGYATNPKYAQKLIKIIEEYHLQDYTYATLVPHVAPPVYVASSASPVAATLMADAANQGEVVPEKDAPVLTDDTPVYGQIVLKDGLKGFYARKGDVLLEYAIQYKTRYAKMLEINSLPDAPLATDMFVFLEKGNTITRIMARDLSAPAAPTVAAASMAAPLDVTSPEPAAAPYVTPEAFVPAAPAPVVPEVIAEVIAPETAPVAASTAPEPVETTATEVGQSPLEAAAAPVTVPAAQPAAQAVAAPTEPIQQPINISNEVAIEEEKPEAAPPVPMDDFARLKARLDKVVYAPSKPAPARTTTPVAAVVPAAKVTAPALPAAATVTGGKVYHTVKGGETAFGIARQYDLSMKELMALNGLNFEAIKVGQKLRVK